MLAALMEGEEEEEGSGRERAIADGLEEQLQLERQREAAIDELHW